MALPYWKQVPSDSLVPSELYPLDRILIKPPNGDVSSQDIPERRLVAIEKNGRLVLAFHAHAPQGKLLGVVIGIRKGEPKPP